MVEGGAKDYMVSATPAPTVVNGKNMYEEGTEVTLTASSNDILTFTNWNDGETGAERKIKMNVDQSYTAAYSAKDFIAGWDFYKSAREGRTADFAAADNDVDQLILRDADGNTYAWLDKSNSAGGYEGKNAAVNWTSKKTKALGETYWQTKVNATAFTDIKVKSSMLYNYNAYETYNVEYSLNGTDWTKVGAIKMQEPKPGPMASSLSQPMQTTRQKYTSAGLPTRLLPSREQQATTTESLSQISTSQVLPSSLTTAKHLYS